MNTEPPQAITSETPIDFRGALKDFEDGQLCWVVARRYQGTGPVRLILHKALLTEDGKGFGSGPHWIVNPATLLGGATSERKKAASRLNGIKGGLRRGPKPNASPATPPRALAVPKLPAEVNLPLRTTELPTPSPALAKALSDLASLRASRTPLLKPSGKL